MRKFQSSPGRILPDLEAIFWLLFIISVITLTWSLLPTASAACLGTHSDGCDPGLYEIPCPHSNRPHRTAKCCASCEKAQQPPPPSPQIQPAPVPAITTTPIEPSLNESKPRDPLDENGCQSLEAIIGLYSGESPVARLSTPDRPPNILSSCQDYDALLSDLESLTLWQSGEEGGDDDAPAIPWLSNSAFELRGILSEIYGSHKLVHVSFHELENTCRRTMITSISFTFTLEQQTGACFPEKLNVTRIEQYKLPTRRPLLSELESPDLLALVEEDIKCAGQLPFDIDDNKQSSNKRLAVGDDCRGHTVYVDYVLTQTKAQDEGIAPGCNDRFTLKRDWDTYSEWESDGLGGILPIPGSRCLDDRLSSTYRVFDDIAPTFGDEESVDSASEDRAYWVRSRKEFENFTLPFVDNCDLFNINNNIAHLSNGINKVESSENKQSRLAKVDSRSVGNSTSLVNARASVTMTASDSCDNNKTITRNVRLRSSDAYDVSEIHLMPIVRVSCRSHVPPAPILRAKDPDGMIHSYAMKHQTFTFPINPVEKSSSDTEEVAADEADGQQTDPEELPICENRLNITRYWAIGESEDHPDDDDHFPVYFEQTYVVDDREGPLWTSSYLPPEHTVLQCENELPNFVEKNDDGSDGGKILTAEDVCDRFELAIVGTQTNLGPEQDPDPSALLSPRSPECLDNTRIVRQWEAKDLCGTVSRHVAIYDILDRTPPQPVPDVERRIHFCLDQGTQVMRDYTCFDDLLDYVKSVIPKDNCGRRITYRFESSQSFECSDDNNLSTCKTLLPTIATKGLVSGTTGIPFVHHYRHNGTVCIAKRSGILHNLVFTSSDVCGNKTPLTLDIYSPQRPVDDNNYNPNLPTHVCDTRHVISVPKDVYWKASESILGTTYQTTRVDQRL